MAITIPTVDEFTESTVMLVIREIAEYICGDNGLVAQINNNDITGFTSSYTNNVLKIDATKGDGSTIPVCNVTIEGGGSSTGNPYPTAVSGTVGVDGNITFTITMSSGSPLTTTINMNYFASTADISDLQEQVTGLKITSSGNTMSINGTSASIVNSISGSVSNGNLKISVNGIESVDIPLPEGGEEIALINFKKNYSNSGTTKNSIYYYISATTKNTKLYLNSNYKSLYITLENGYISLPNFNTSDRCISIPSAEFLEYVNEIYPNLNDGIYQFYVIVVADDYIRFTFNPSSISNIIVENGVKRISDANIVVASDGAVNHYDKISIVINRLVE